MSSPLSGNGYLFKNGVVSLPPTDTPSVPSFLESHPGSAYTTTRTHNNASQILFWDRHITRLSNSVKLLLNANPKLLFGGGNGNVIAPRLSDREIRPWESLIRCLVDDSIRKVMPFVVNERREFEEEELAITTLVSGVSSENVDRLEEGGGFDVYMHVGGYVPARFGDNAARLAVVGRGRDLANAKYSDWVRLRRPLEKLRPPSVTELLLSNDGDGILEGCLTNFFVVCLKEKDGDDDTVKQYDLQSARSIEVQTAPISDGVLPGVIRQVIRDVCLDIGIPFREVTPSWSKRELWTEAFITNSLRIVQHVKTIQAPDSWKSVESNTWADITWVEKRFEDGPGRITEILQTEIMKKAGLEAFSVSSFDGGWQ